MSTVSKLAEDFERRCSSLNDRIQESHDIDTCLRESLKNADSQQVKDIMAKLRLEKSIRENCERELKNMRVQLYRYTYAYTVFHYLPTGDGNPVVYFTNKFQGHDGIIYFLHLDKCKMALTGSVVVHNNFSEYGDTVYEYNL